MQSRHIFGGIKNYVTSAWREIGGRCRSILVVREYLRDEEVAGVYKDACRTPRLRQREGAKTVRRVIKGSKG